MLKKENFTEEHIRDLQRVPMAGTLQIANVLFGKILFLQHGLTPFLTVICLSAQAPWP